MIDAARPFRLPPREALKIQKPEGIAGEKKPAIKEKTSELWTKVKNWLPFWKDEVKTEPNKVVKQISKVDNDLPDKPIELTLETRPDLKTDESKTQKESQVAINENEPEVKDEVTKKEFVVNYNDKGVSRTFNFSKQDYEASIPGLKEELVKSRESQEMLEGCIDRDGKIWWKKDNEWFPKHLWSKLTGRPVSAVFNYFPNKNGLEIQSAGDAETSAIVSYFDKSGLQDYRLLIHELPNTAVLETGRFKFEGERKNWENTSESFIKDKEIPRESGYERVPFKRIKDTIKGIYDDARNRGKYLAVRTVGRAVEPNGLSSASLFAPGHTELFDARIGDYDKGALIYEVDESVAKLCFSEDAATFIFPKDKAPTPRDDQAVLETGENLILYRNNATPVTLNQLQENALNTGEDRQPYSEIVIDPNSENCHLKAIVNPFDVQGWSRIAYQNGVLEFMEVPEFGLRSKNDFRITAKLSNT